MTIFDLSVGQSAEILQIQLYGATALRLAAMGVAIKKRITVLSFSFFHSSILIGCGNVRLAIRKDLAQKIQVRVESSSPFQMAKGGKA
jgi:Fe2+ transport system protein FeoA